MFDLKAIYFVCVCVLWMAIEKEKSVEPCNSFHYKNSHMNKGKWVKRKGSWCIARLGEKERKILEKHVMSHNEMRIKEELL